MVQQTILQMMMKVMDIDELIFLGDGTRSRFPRSSTARGSTDAEVPVPKSMPKPLAKAVARNQAMHVSDLIANMMAAQVAAQNDEVF